MAVFLRVADELRAPCVEDALGRLPKDVHHRHQRRVARPFACEIIEDVAPVASGVQRDVPSTNLRPVAELLRLTARPAMSTYWRLWTNGRCRDPISGGGDLRGGLPRGRDPLRSFRARRGDDSGGGSAPRKACAFPCPSWQSAHPSAARHRRRRRSGRRARGDRVPDPVELVAGATPSRLSARSERGREKFEAMVSLDTQNSRMKDFHDIWALAGEFAFDGPSLQKAVRTCFERRTTRWTAEAPRALTAAFYQRPEIETRWRHYLADGAVLAPVPRQNSSGQRVQGLTDLRRDVELSVAEMIIRCRNGTYPRAGF